MIGHFESSIGGEIEPGQFPQPVLKSAQVILAIDANFFDDFLIEVVKKLLPRVAPFVVDFRFQFILKLVELELDLFWRAALLIYSHDPFLKINPRFNGPENFVTRAEHTAEQAKLLVEQLVNSLVRGVFLV